MCCLLSTSEGRLLPVFELGMCPPELCDPSFRLRWIQLNKSGSLHSSDTSEMGFNPSLFDHPTGKCRKRFSSGTHLPTKPPDLLTCFLLRGESAFSQQHDPILNCVSATDRNIGRLSILPKRNHI